jgi:hypothetical protein
MLVFTGDLDDKCPITLTTVRDLKWAVAFCADTDHAYECTALVRWLSKRWSNPLTNEAVPRGGFSMWSNTVHEIIQPLDICTDTHAAAEYIRCHIGENARRLIFNVPHRDCVPPDIRPCSWIKQGACLYVAISARSLTISVHTEWKFVLWTFYFIVSSVSHFQSAAPPCMQYTPDEPCSALISTGAAMFGIVYFVCRFKDAVVAQYFVTTAGAFLESAAILLHDGELAYLVQFALYFTALGFHTEEAHRRLPPFLYGP